ncbi:hypothetical protein SBA4_2520001 [Candidatus Sulfopaludibacter sp. SbA4]|nr:hypothetical protein SBA4_2520001 [Candidatus Sulfopaludibacter sp. SbA4]
MALRTQAHFPLVVNAAFTDSGRITRYSERAAAPFNRIRTHKRPGATDQPGRIAGVPERRRGSWRVPIRHSRMLGFLA